MLQHLPHNPDLAVSGFHFFGPLTEPVGSQRPPHVHCGGFKKLMAEGSYETHAAMGILCEIGG